MLNYNIPTLIRQLLPSFLRKPIRIAWLNALLSPLIRMWSEYGDWRTEKVYEAHVTPQTISLQAYLNRLFDPVQQRIRITHGEEAMIYIELRGEGYDLYIDGDDGEYVELEGEQTAEIISGFTVEIPADVNPQQVGGIVDMLKAAGVPYEIVIV